MLVSIRLFFFFTICIITCISGMGCSFPREKQRVRPTERTEAKAYVERERQRSDQVRMELENKVEQTAHGGDLLSLVYQVRANAVWDAFLRMDKSLLLDIYPLLQDPMPEVAANARWYFHEMTGLPFSFQTSWCSRWARYFLIDQNEDNEIMRRAGIPTLSAKELELVLRLSAPSQLIQKEFGGDVLVILELENVSTKPMTLYFTQNDTYTITRYKEGGEEQSERRGEVVQVDAGWDQRRSGLVDGLHFKEHFSRRRELELTRVDIAPGSKYNLTMKLSMSEYLKIDKNNSRWNYFHSQVCFTAAHVLLTMGEQIYYVNLDGPSTVVRSYRKVYTIEQLSSRRLQDSFFESSDFSALQLCSDHINQLIESSALYFMDRCVYELDQNNNLLWQQFLIELLERHLPILSNSNPQRMYYSAQRLRERMASIRLWWTRNSSQVYFDTAMGQWQINEPLGVSDD